MQRGTGCGPPNALVRRLLLEGVDTRLLQLIAPRIPATGRGGHGGRW